VENDHRTLVCASRPIWTWLREEPRTHKKLTGEGKLYFLNPTATVRNSIAMETEGRLQGCNTRKLIYVIFGESGNVTGTRALTNGNRWPHPTVLPELPVVNLLRIPRVQGKGKIVPVLN